MHMKWLSNIMGLADKVKEKEVREVKQIDKSLLTDKEAAFIISKLRQASYQGTEFEAFYVIMAKLQNLADKKS